MQKIEKHPTFVGPLAEYCAGLYAEKRALGYRYGSHGNLLKELDRFFLEQNAEPHCLPKELVQCWISKRAHESHRNQEFRVGGIRQLALFMARQGMQAYIPPTIKRSDSYQNFTPYIFTTGEVSRLLAAADGLRPYRSSPKRHLIMPVIFRLLYGCGLRVSEACALRIRDVNVSEGILTIRRTKFDKDRLVPVAPSLMVRLQHYTQQMLMTAGPDMFFFPAPDQGQFSSGALYGTFRTLLRICGISHGGTGRGPRMHDLRHTFAVHCLQRWVRDGRDLSTALPVLSTYLGHNSLYGTQRYLRLTAELYPDITAAIETHFSTVIPERNDT